MNKELEALALSAAKALDLGIVGVNAKRAKQWGVPLGRACSKGDDLPGHSKKASAAGYYCPYSVWRPPSGKCLYIDHVGHGDGKSHYRIALLSEDSTGHGTFAGQNNGFSLAEIKAYLRGVADTASLALPRRRGR